MWLGRTHRSGRCLPYITGPEYFQAAGPGGALRCPTSHHRQSRTVAGAMATLNPVTVATNGLRLPWAVCRAAQELFGCHPSLPIPTRV